MLNWIAIPPSFLVLFYTGTLAAPAWADAFMDLKVRLFAGILLIILCLLLLQVLTPNETPNPSMDFGADGDADRSTLKKAPAHRHEVHELKIADAQGVAATHTLRNPTDL